MAGLPEVIGLLYRADWTRLSLSAEVRFEQDGDLARRRENAVRAEGVRRMGFRPGSPGMPDVEQEPDAERDVYHRWHAALLIAPGRRYRLEYEGDHGGRAGGSDGEQAWTLRPPDAAPLPPLGFEVVSGLPVPALFRPAGLLAGFTLDVGGPVTACGREAIAVTAVPRHGAVGSGRSLRPPACDRVELIVDAETGILLRREETFEGQALTLFELTTVTMSPPEADDPARFAPPAGSRPVRDPEDAPGRSGLGWQVAANAAGLAAGGLGAWLRLAPHLPGHRPAAEASVLAAMPSPEPGPLDPGDGPLPSDDLLGLLYRSGRYDGDDPQVRGAAVRRWNDTKAVWGQVPGTFRAAGHGGVGYLLDTVSRNETVTLSAGQLRIGGPELYYLEYSSWQGRPGPLVMACDGEQYWGIHENRARVGPARNGGNWTTSPRSPAIPLTRPDSARTSLPAPASWRKPATPSPITPRQFPAWPAPRPVPPSRPSTAPPAPSPPPGASWTTSAAIASALATNVHRLGYAASGFGRPGVAGVRCGGGRRPPR